MGGIILDNIKVQYGKRVVLNGITLSFDKRGFIALVGGNGSGKSTLAKVIAGVVDHTGRVYDEETKKLPKVGYVWQNPEWGFIATTVWEEVVLSYLLRGFPHKKAYEEARLILSEFGLYTFRDYPISKLSGGYRQVLATITMLITEPDVMIFDEVTSMLDPKERYMVLGYISHLSKKKAVILITQISEDIKYADRVWAISNGEIVYDGDPEELWKIDYRKFGLTLPSTYTLTSKWGVPWKPLSSIR